MKVAYCISGFMRTFEETYESQLRHILEPNNCDIFISTWNYVGKMWADKRDDDICFEPTSESKLREFYGDRLKTCQIHDFDSVQKALPNYFYQGMVSMYWQIKQCDLLRKEFEQSNGFKYDVIIRSRADLTFMNGIKISSPETIGDQLLVYSFDDINMGDMFAIGQDPAMTYYTSLFDHLAQYDQMKPFYKAPPGFPTPWWPEATLFLHMKRSGIPFVKIPVKFEICRYTGKK
jgi:hypothetical protein